MFEVTGRRRWIAAIVVLFTLAVVSTASAANKPYSLAISPGAAGSGTVTMTAMFAVPNTASQQLGSANLLPPAGFTVTSASVPPPGTAALAPCTVGTRTGTCVQLRNLAVAPGQSVTVTMTVQVSAPASCPAPSTSTWSVEAKQANNFNGTGNDLNLDTGSSSLTTRVSCANTTSTSCPQGQSCSTSLSTSASTLEVTANAGPAATLSESVDVGNTLVCSNYQARDPNWYGFVVNTTERSKLITYTVNNTSPTGVEFCFGAPYEFETLGDQNAPKGTLPDGTQGFIGLLERCESFPEPPEACVQSIVASGPNTVITVRIDAGLQGDPWGHG